PQFFDELMKTQQGNYRLFQAGSLLDDVPTKDAEAAADYLFDELVSSGASPVSAVQPAEQLRDASNRVLDDAGLKGRDDFHTRYIVKCRVKNMDWPIQFDYALGKDAPKSVFQRVQVRLTHSVQSSAFMFESLSESENPLDKTSLGALVNVGED